MGASHSYQCQISKAEVSCACTPQASATPSLQSQFPFVMNINENLELNTMAALAGKRELSSVKQGDIIFPIKHLLA